MQLVRLMARRCSVNAISLLFSLTLRVCFLPSATAEHILSSNQSISDGDTLVSPNNLFELRFFSPDGSESRYVGIWYHDNIQLNRPVWVANREIPLENTTGILWMKADGNLVVAYGGSGSVVWSSTDVLAQESNGSTAVLEDNGNLVVREARSGAVLWESFDHPCDTLLPGMKIGVDLKTGRNRMLTSWRRQDDPSPGIYAFGIDRQDPNQFFIWRESLPYWRVIFRNDSGFNVIHASTDMFTDVWTKTLPLSEDWGVNASVVRENDEIYLTISLSPGARHTWLAIKTYGGIKSYLEGAQYDEDNWMKPRQRQCSTDALCGPNSSCNENEEPMCKCLPGFKPTSTADWNSGNWRHGCIKTHELQCGAKDDHLTLNGATLRLGLSGEYYGTTADNMTMITCRQLCDKYGCECKAYAFVDHRCYFWRATEVKDLQEDGDDDGTGFVQQELNIRVASSILSATRRQCGYCGANIIPYPLSTGPNCGDPAYSSFHCNSSTGQLRFLTPDGSSYAVSGISPENRTFLIKPEGLDLCWAGSSKRSDIHLNSSLPFRVTENNTVLLLNCSSNPRNQVPLNCSSSGPCYTYIREGRAPCFYSAMCCSYITRDSRSSTLHKIGVLDSGCSSYVSIVNWDMSMNIAAWKERVQIEWHAPPEPVCDSEDDCRAWPNSTCLSPKTEVRRKRCLCNDNFHWDQFLMNCAPNGDGGRLSGKKKLLVYLMATGVFGIILFAASICCLWRKRIGKEKQKKWSFRVTELLEGANGNESIDVPFIDFKYLVEATENFSDSNKLGKGGFGIVYKGTLPGEQEIAVKRLSSSSRQGQEEFKNEVLLIAKLQHRNLVRMLGYCIKDSEKMLIYEYMPNKSLDFFLFDSSRCIVLDWEKRFNIIMGISRGLLYLHQDSRLRIIHRDLKTSNILLDKDMNPKISDFGMARIFGGNQTQENTSRVVGTYGYISPEYAANGLFSVKSDVYSFGMIILEIVSGRKNADFYKKDDVSSLTAYAWQLWKEGRGLELMDPSLLETCNEAQVLKCIYLGLLCVQENALDRPSMSSVLAILDGETSSFPAPNEPAFFKGRFSVAPASSSGGMPKYSNNDMTISILEAR